MKTSDDLWRWIWEDEDDFLDRNTMRDLLGPEADSPAGLEPPPTVTTEGVWDWVASDDDLIDTDLLDLEPTAHSAPEPVTPEAAAPALQMPWETVDAFEWPPPPPPPPPLVEISPGMEPTVLEPAPPPVVEPPVEREPEPIFEAEPEPIFEAEPEPMLEAEPEPIFEAELVIDSPPVVEPDPVVEAGPVVEVEPVADAETVLEPPLEPEPVVEAEPVVEPELIVEAEPVVEPEPVVEADPVVEPEPERLAPAPVAQTAAPTVRPAPAEVPDAPRTRTAWLARIGAFLAVVAVVAVVAPRVLPAVLPNGDGDAGPSAVVEQNVVAWTVRLDEAPGSTFVAIMAAGVKSPVIMAVPADVTINVPGQGLGTVGEAAAGGDVGLVAVALENLIGVRMDGSVDSTTGELQAAADALGSIEVADQAMSGAQVIQYLAATDPGALPDERFLRWQDVLEGIRDGVAANPAAVAGFPEPLRPVLTAGSPEPMALYGLPVVDLGAGLLRPDEEALGTLVADLFVPHAGDEVRIVVLNGAGRPGVGEEVARILVPEGYRLMSTGNANTFGVKTTKIIALSENALADAQRARDHLGVGQVLLAEPAGLADVQIVVGQDFVDAHLGGA